MNNFNLAKGDVFREHELGTSSGFSIPLGYATS